MENNNLLLNLQPEVITLILSYLIFEAYDFSGFARLLIVWERRQPRSYVKTVLERMNWDLLYDFHQHPMEVTRDQFYGFIAFSVRNNVHQAMFFDSSMNLFRHINVEHHLQVLSTLSGTHFPSHFSFLFFKAIYRPFEVDVTALQMVQCVNNLFLRRKLEELLNLLADIYNNILGVRSILPIRKFCPNARNREAFNLLDGPPLHVDLWNSLCDLTVEGNYHEQGDIWGKHLTMQHIWKAECPHCTLQLIVYKILLSIPLY